MSNKTSSLKSVISPTLICLAGFVFTQSLSPASAQSDSSFTMPGAHLIKTVEIDYSDPAVINDAKVEAAFSRAYGLLTYEGDNEAALSDLAKFTQNDRALIYDSLYSAEYTRNAIASMVEACRYFETTAYDQLDAEYLARNRPEAQELELRDRKAFVAGLYLQLSKDGKNQLDHYMSRFDPGNRAGRVSKVDAVEYAKAYPEQVKSSFYGSCTNIYDAADDLANNEPRSVQMTTLTPADLK
ncbi:MAG: hypothetical protein AB8B95_01825 [Pseudohongiellaceae bacterium]